MKKVLEGTVYSKFDFYILRKMFLFVRKFGIMSKG